MPRLLIASPWTGSGKTTVVAAIARALRHRGLRVQPFKVGPDYIDPGYHTRAAETPTRNLDSWLLRDSALRELFVRADSAADLSIVEGMMGLFDGRDDQDEGSTAAAAKLLDLPVVLVIDVSRMSRSAAAVALGCHRFDTDVALQGFILNRVAGEGHYRIAAGPIEAATGLPVFGYMPEDPRFELPERHLGLVPTAERPLNNDLLDQLADTAERTVDINGLLALAGSVSPLASVTPELFPPGQIALRARVAVAMDEAFSFYYEDNLDLLTAWGAELAPFSPLHDSELPAGCGGIYIGGGFPEVYARDLAANDSMKKSLDRAAADGMPIYAECGGLMYLCQGIVDFDGVRHPMVGLVPGWSALEQPRLSIGYRAATAQRDSLLLRAGEQVRGHEFHWSQLQADPARESCAYAFEETGRLEGYASGNLLASYLHVHFGADARLAPRFVAACEGHR